jgi:hypothetical protein
MPGVGFSTPPASSRCGSLQIYTISGQPNYPVSSLLLHYIINNKENIQQSRPSPIPPSAHQSHQSHRPLSPSAHLSQFAYSGITSPALQPDRRVQSAVAASFLHGLSQSSSFIWDQFYTGRPLPFFTCLEQTVPSEHFTQQRKPYLP